MQIRSYIEFRIPFFLSAASQTLHNHRTAMIPIFGLLLCNSMLLLSSSNMKASSGSLLDDGPEIALDSMVSQENLLLFQDNELLAKHMQISICNCSKPVRKQA